MSLRLGVAGEQLDGLSGSARRLIDALGDFADVVVIPLPRYQPTLGKRIVKRIQRSFGSEYLWEKEIRRVRYLSRALDDAAAASGVDAVVVVGTEACAYCETQVPLVGFGDSIFGSRVDLYPDQISSRIAAQSFREGILVQQRALDRMRVMFMTSRFAWQRAIDRFHYEVSEEKLFVTLVGANIDGVEPRAFPTGPQWRFLWIGLDWVRKRGDFAVQVVEDLRRRGIDAHLDVVGSAPPLSGLEFVTLHGKVTDDGQRSALFAAAAAILLPTRGDLTPVSIAEAAALGRPSVASLLGGIPEMVRNGEEAILLPPEDPAQWAEAIDGALRDGRLAAMGLRARAAYESRLNWPGIARRMVDRIAAELQ